jgi:hypothetical protein
MHNKKATDFYISGLLFKVTIFLLQGCSAATTVLSAVGFQPYRIISI